MKELQIYIVNEFMSIEYTSRKRCGCTLNLEKYEAMRKNSQNVSLALHLDIVFAVFVLYLLIQFVLRAILLSAHCFLGNLFPDRYIFYLNSFLVENIEERRKEE